MKHWFIYDSGFRYTPDDQAAGGAGAPAATPAASPATTPTPSASSPAAPAAAATTTPSAASSAPATGGTSTPAASPAPAATPSWLDGFRQAGVFQGDVSEDAARARLIQDARDAQQLRQLAPFATEYQQHQNEFQEFLRQRQADAQKKQAETDWTKNLGWNPPEYDPNWVTQLKRDDQGNIVALPGAPADIAIKYQRYEQWRQQEVQKLVSNPGKYMEPYMRHIATEIAKEQAQQNVGSYKEQVEAQGFIQQHSDWLFDRDASGQIKSQSVFNPKTGKYDTTKTLSPLGRMFYERLSDYNNQGFSAAQQQQFAFNDVRIAYMSSPEYTKYLLAEQQKQQAAAAGQQPGGGAGAATPEQTARQQANAAFLQKTNPATPPTPTGGNAVPAPQQVTRHNLGDILLKRMKEQGVTIS